MHYAHDSNTLKFLNLYHFPECNAFFFIKVQLSSSITSPEICESVAGKVKPCVNAEPFAFKLVVGIDRLSQIFCSVLGWKYNGQALFENDAMIVLKTYTTCSK